MQGILRSLSEVEERVEALSPGMFAGYSPVKMGVSRVRMRHNARRQRRSPDNALGGLGHTSDKAKSSLPRELLGPHELHRMKNRLLSSGMSLEGSPFRWPPASGASWCNNGRPMGRPMAGSPARAARALRFEADGDAGLHGRDMIRPHTSPAAPSYIVRKSQDRSHAPTSTVTPTRGSSRISTKPRVRALPSPAASPARLGSLRKPTTGSGLAAMSSSPDMLQWQRAPGAGQRSRPRPATSAAVSRRVVVDEGRGSSQPDPAPVRGASGSVDQGRKYPTLLRASQDRRQFGSSNRKHAKPKVRSVRDDWVVQ